MAEKTTAIAVTEQTVSNFVRGSLPNLMNYAVRTYDPDAWAKTVMLCIVDNPDLMACLQTEAGKRSLYHALRYAASTGLSLNPQEGKAALVPIQGKVHYWVEKGGMVDLVMETGAVKLIRANAVKATDKFRLTETLDGDTYEFSPASKNRGEIVGFFAAAKLKDGGSVVEWMTKEEVDAHRDTYAKGLNRPDSAWKKSYEGMGIKTVMKALCRKMKLPSEAERVIEAAKDSAEAAETIPGTFEEIPGVTAGELEQRLKEKHEGEKSEGQGQQPGSQSPAGQPPAGQGAQQPGAQTAAAGQQPAAGTAGPGAPAGSSTGSPPQKKKDELDIF